MVALICDAQAPGHSSWHWEIESQWATARRLLGEFTFGTDEGEGVSGEESKIKKAEEALKEYVA